MKIKVINFLLNGKRMHLQADAELGVTVQHLKHKFKDFQVHSIHPEEGPIIIFKPPAHADEFEGENDNFRRFGIFVSICIVFIIIWQTVGQCHSSP